MKTLMLDTDISSYVIKGTESVIMEKFESNFPVLCISSITAGELKFGACKKTSKALTEKIEAFCNLIPVKEWNLRTAHHYGNIRAAMEKNGTLLGSMDMLIAACAVETGAVLVTNNIKHFSKVSGLKVINWME